MVRSILPLVLLMIGSLTPRAAVAQEPPERESTGVSALLDNVDLLIDNYARFVSRKYNLTEEQDLYTKELIRERAHGFLDKHNDKLRGMLEQLFEVRSGGDASPEELKRWGEEIRPLFDEAKTMIEASNGEFREILSDEQRKTHDADLKLMNETFSTTDAQISKMVSGQMTAEELRQGTRPAGRSSRPPTPRPQTAPPPPGGAPGEAKGAPSGQQTADPADPQSQAEVVAPAGETVPPVVSGVPVTPAPSRGERVDRRAPRSRAVGKDFEGEWDKYVKDFIAKYSLDESQQQQAATILADCKTQATRYADAKKSEIATIDGQLEETKKSTDKDKSKKLADLNAQRTKLMEPVGKIFEEQLKPRLEKIPTRAQRKAAAQTSGRAGAVVKPAQPPAKPTPPAESQPAEQPANEEQKDDEGDDE